jgi:hypothetical protein
VKLRFAVALGLTTAALVAGVSSAPLYRTAMVPVVGYVGSDVAYTYVRWGQVRPDGKIRIHGPKPGWTYTVTISGQIPAVG